MVMPSKTVGTTTSELDKAIIENASEQAVPSQIELPAEASAEESAE
jgi:hypothetical protein